jgi:G3E family GTPase
MRVMPASAPNRPPVTVLSGFLGAGKTTLLRHLLGQARSAGSGRAEGRKWAAVVNDVAALNIDAQLVADAGARRVVELGNGCVCCSVRDELAETVAELAAPHSTSSGQAGGYEHIFIETTGVAEPRAVADLFIRKNAFGRSLGDFARLAALVTVVDARLLLAEWKKPRAARSSDERVKPIAELMAQQVECADVLVLNKADTVTGTQLEEAAGLLHGLNPRAEIFHTEHGQLPVEVLLERQRFDAAATLRAARWVRVLDGTADGQVAKARPAVVPHRKAEARHERDYGITSFVYQARRPFDGVRLQAWLAGALPAGLLRAKGYCWLAERPADIGFISVAGGTVNLEWVGTWAAALCERGVITPADIPAAAQAKWVEPHGDRRQELVFIGVQLDESALGAALDGCLG